jgi:hypothetical protein
MKGNWFISPHAVRRFIERVWPHSTYEEALDHLIEMSKVSKLVRQDHTPGVDMYRTPNQGKKRGIRLLVSRRLPGKPQLVTVLVGGKPSFPA